MDLTKTRIIQWSIVLLDADVIIDLHRFGIWKKIIKKNIISIPSTVLRREVYFYKDKNDVKHNINLIKEIGKTITEVQVNAEELLDFRKKFECFIEEELDSGETEALKILNDRDDCNFCTCFKEEVRSAV